MLKRIKDLSQRGDTIIEVMIVLAVLGLAISICYATANRSLLNTRQAQENSEATELLQEQIEALRTIACGNGVSGCVQDPRLTQPAPYCLIQSGNTYVYNPYTSDPNNSCNKMGSVPYRIQINFTSNPNTFTAKAEWDSIQGSGTDSVSLSYRLPL